MIPLVNLNAQYKKLEVQIKKRIEEVLDSGAFIQGEFVSEFEYKFNSISNVPFGCACSNGTSAIHLALSALGVGAGDEVITVPSTFIATAEGIIHSGASPKFVDINPDTYGIDVCSIEHAITDRTKAILPVHLYGNPSDIDGIKKIAEKYNLLVIEDCAQAHLAEYKNEYVGSFGDAATFSFYPGKNLGAYGDAGFVFTKTKKSEERIRKLLDHGRLSKYEHDIVGYNYRMDAIQAVVLTEKLKHLKDWTEVRRRNAKLYDSLLTKHGFKVLVETEGAKSVYHLYVVEVANRNEVMDFLKSKGVATAIHYPIPLHLQPALRYLNIKEGSYPNSELTSSRLLSLPMCAELSEEQISMISAEFLKVARPI